MLSSIPLKKQFVSQRYDHLAGKLPATMLTQPASARIGYNLPMSVEEIETIISQLSSPELTRLAAWFEEHQANLWDRQIEADALAGRLDALGAQADQEFEAGRCRPL